jgi:hypothetical protein
MTYIFRLVKKKGRGVILTDCQYSSGNINFLMNNFSDQLSANKILEKQVIKLITES